MTGVSVEGVRDREECLGGNYDEKDPRYGTDVNWMLIISVIKSENGSDEYGSKSKGTSLAHQIDG